MITLNCDRCDKPFEIEDDAAGEKVECPYCGDINRVPLQATTSLVKGKPVDQAKVEPGSNEPERMLAVVRQAMFRAHPFWYSLMVIIFLGGITLAILSRTSQQFANARWVAWVGVAMIAIAILWWLIWWAKPSRWNTLIITTRRVTFQQGMFNRTSNDVFHTKIQDIKVNQSFWQRLLGVGYIGIDCAGQGGKVEDVPGQPERRSEIEIEMYDAPRPLKLRELINQYRR